MRSPLTHVLLASAIAVLGACSDALSPESLAGTYVATTFTVSGEVSGDVLAEGGNLTITLNADRTTTGNLLIPASLAYGEDFTASMVGTFTIIEETLTFAQDADTFIRDLFWTVNESQLRSTGTFSGVTITIVLSRQ
ncbi:MAG: hypothetical protein PVF27_09175 [Gemmatimonadales bacterium]|jgi:hypothetical protein